MEILIPIIVAVVAVSVGAVGGSLYRRGKVDALFMAAHTEANHILTIAEENYQTLRQEAEAERNQLQAEAEEELARREMWLEQHSERLQKRHESLSKQFEALKEAELAQKTQHKALNSRRQEISGLVQKQRQALEQVSNLTYNEARTEILAHTRQEMLKHQLRQVREAEEEIKEWADRRARDIVTLAIQRVASRQVSSNGSSVIALRNSKDKRRIIGRGGRNIQAFEKAAQVELNINDDDNTIVINSPDPLKRELGRRALERLLAMKHFNASRIEKVIARTESSLQNTIQRAGKSAIRKAKAPRLPREVVDLLGRLEYRTSYGQNQRLHLIETAHLATIIAYELGADVETARLGGLLHDIGKAMTHEVEGPHAIIGADALRPFNSIPPLVINAVASHHHEVEQESLEAIIVEAADAISGARPGARRENLESYVARIQTLERIANSFNGVKESYAIQAGREVRVLVNPDRVDDAEAQKISEGIARQIEESVQYPGQIAVTVIRETKAVDYAN